MVRQHPGRKPQSRWSIHGPIPGAAAHKRRAGQTRTLAPRALPDTRSGANDTTTTKFCDLFRFCNKQDWLLLLLLVCYLYSRVSPLVVFEAEAELRSSLLATRLVTSPTADHRIDRPRISSWELLLRCRWRQGRSMRMITSLLIGRWRRRCMLALRFDIVMIRISWSRGRTLM